MQTYPDKGSGHETESSQEVRHVLTLLASPYIEGPGEVGGCLWSPLCTHHAVDLTKAAFTLHFDPVVLFFAARTGRPKGSGGCCC